MFLFYVVYDVMRKKALIAKPGAAELIVKIKRQRKRRACLFLFAGALLLQAQVSGSASSRQNSHTDFHYA